MLLSAYALAIAAGTALSAFRREMTVVRGTSVLWTTGAFLIADVALAVRSADFRSPGLIVLPLVALALVPIRDRWIISRFDEAPAREIFEHSMDQLRIPYETTISGYLLRTKGGRAGLWLRRLPTSRAIVRLSDESGSRKVELLRALLLKRFGRLVPRPHIRFR